MVSIELHILLVLDGKAEIILPMLVPKLVAVNTCQL